MILSSACPSWRADQADPRPKGRRSSWPATPRGGTRSSMLSYLVIFRVFGPKIAAFWGRLRRKCCHSAVLPRKHAVMLKCGRNRPIASENRASAATRYDQDRNPAQAVSPEKIYINQMYMWPRCPNAVWPCIASSATMFYRNPAQICLMLRKRRLCRLPSQGKNGRKW